MKRWKKPVMRRGNDLVAVVFPKPLVAGEKLRIRFQLCGIGFVRSWRRTSLRRSTPAHVSKPRGRGCQTLISSSNIRWDGMLATGKKNRYKKQ